MTIGTPDHVQAVDTNLIGYVNKHNSTSLIIGAYSVKYGIEVTGQGAFGFAQILSDHASAVFSIWVDDVIIFSQSPYNCRNVWGLYGPAMDGLFGCTNYDLQTDEYTMWVNFRYDLVFYNSLKVGISDVNGDTITCTFYGLWKERS